MLYWLRAVPFTIFWIFNRVFYALAKPLLERFVIGSRSQLAEAREFYLIWSHRTTYRHFLAHLGTRGADTSWNAEVILTSASGDALRVLLRIPVQVHLLPVSVLPAGPAHVFAARGVVDRQGVFRVTTDGWQHHFDIASWREFCPQHVRESVSPAAVAPPEAHPHPLR
jgi:hypothetical protein